MSAFSHSPRPVITLHQGRGAPNFGCNRSAACGPSTNHSERLRQRPVLCIQNDSLCRICVKVQIDYCAKRFFNTSLGCEVINSFWCVVTGEPLPNSRFREAVLYGDVVLWYCRPRRSAGVDGAIWCSDSTLLYVGGAARLVD